MEKIHLKKTEPAQECGKTVKQVTHLEFRVTKLQEQNELMEQEIDQMSRSLISKRKELQSVFLDENKRRKQLALQRQAEC